MVQHDWPIQIGHRGHGLRHKAARMDGEHSSLQMLDFLLPLGPTTATCDRQFVSDLQASNCQQLRILVFCKLGWRPSLLG